MHTRTAFQLARAYEGKAVAWDTGDFVFVDCQVIDARVFYGRELLLIRPLSGNGEKWVRASKCRVKNADETDENRPDRADAPVPRVPLPTANRRRGG